MAHTPLKMTGRRVIIKLVGAAIKLWLKSWREGRAFRRALKKIEDSTLEESL